MPALTPEQEALKQAALAAVSENWTSDDDVVYGPDGDSVCICHGNIGNMPEAIEADDRATFIALANPAAILAILAQLEATGTVPSVPDKTGTTPADAAAQRKGSPECTICADTGKAFGKVCDCGCVATDGGAAPGDAG